ncbi:MAG: DUF4062 domain-containing protein [Acidobacteria bacterium]|nr:DUF4062 domain-containing protein [Acidobacteriota bacterium]MBI3426474.1 DUF4062 domain-containing protein [Acidobacteriota bacterium]
MPARPGQLTAMISSTARDLPEHRQEALDACLRQSIFPVMMEHLPASDDEAIGASLQMVDDADIYLGVFAHRYGYVPAGHQISVTEMEYDRAVERKIPRLIFEMGKDHPIKFEDVEVEAAAQLKAFKDRVGTENIVNFFNSPADLRANAINSLSQVRAKLEETKGTSQKFNFHPPNLIPTAPAPYIAHPYSLLQTGQVIGRREELKLLTDWVTRNASDPASIRLFNVVAIGGMGKSALTWKWFNEIAPNELPQLAGRMWWSFYESDAYFENFVIRALAYTSGMPETEVRQLAPDVREDRLFHLLDTQPFLLVLDGLERILLAYARMDDLDADLGTHRFQRADSAADGMKAEEIPSGIRGSQAETAGKDASVPREKHRLRMCSDPRAGRFLRRLAQVRAARVLVSTRLYPAELQTTTAQPRPGCYALFLEGLSDDDALALWRAFIGGERSGARARLLPCFRAFGNYPLLLRALAGEVAEYKPAPGDFDRWLQDHPDFNPAELDLRNARTHVLGYALEGLRDTHTRTLQTLAAFRMPATWETLCAVLVGKGKKPCRDQSALVAVLTELEDRGLVGWDKAANRYDLHPIVRSVVWSKMSNKMRRVVCKSSLKYFDSLPKIGNPLKVNNLSDLTLAIERYITLVHLGRYNAALWVFFKQLNSATLYRLGASRQAIELLEMLFPAGLDQLPTFGFRLFQFWVFNQLALGYIGIGQPERAITLFRRANILQSLSTSRGNLSEALLRKGKIYQAEVAARRSFIIGRDRFPFLKGRSPVLSEWGAKVFGVKSIFPLLTYGLILALRGITSKSESILKQSLRVLANQSEVQAEGRANSRLAQRALWLKEFAKAKVFATHAWELSSKANFEGDFILAARLQGEAALGRNHFATANEHLHHALTRARAVNLELPALIALAELRRQQSSPDEARELLDAVWDSAARGPYPLFHADALNVLAALERDAGQTEAAIAAATAAYRHAWCDGPPYAYHWGLTAARRHLQELGSLEPQLPPFDPTRHEPMPAVDINPRDEFYVEVGEEEAE